MGIYIIRVPDIGEGIAEVELAAWHVAPGQPVQEDQPVADVMTDKATVEIPSPVSGKVLALGGAVGGGLGNNIGDRNTREERYDGRRGYREVHHHYHGKKRKHRHWDD